MQQRLWIFRQRLRTQMFPLKNHRVKVIGSVAIWRKVVTSGKISPFEAHQDRVRPKRLPCDPAIFSGKVVGVGATTQIICSLPVGSRWFRHERRWLASNQHTARLPLCHSRSASLKSQVPSCQSLPNGLASALRRTRNSRTRAVHSRPPHRLWRRVMRFAVCSHPDIGREVAVKRWAWNFHPCRAVRAIGRTKAFGRNPGQKTQENVVYECRYARAGLPQAGRLHGGENSMVVA